MTRGLLLSITLLAVGLLTAGVSAAPVSLGNGITVDCQMSDSSPCILVSPFKWAIAEGANDAAIQPGIALFFNVPFTVTGAINMLDANGVNGALCPSSNYPASCISDRVSFLNSAQNNNNGVVDFFSDPNQNILPLTNLPVGCIESTVAGCSFTFTVTTPNNGGLIFTVFSDGNFPSGGSLTSDTIQVTATPEPSAIVLVGLGLVSLSWKRRR